MSEPDEHLADRLAEDLERVLGQGVVVRDVQVSGDGPLHAEIALLADGRIQSFEVEAADVEGLYRAVVQAAADLRLSGAWWQIVGPT
jgi:predicted RecB family endonuclease